MEFRSKKRAVAAAPARPTSAQPLLSMYKGAVRYEITIGDFEVWALNRLRVLKGIENLRTRGLHPREMSTKVQKLLDTHLPGPANRSMQAYKEWRRVDEVSHHILRLAYCQTQDKRRWFTTHEQALFRHRFYAAQSDADAIDAFMSANGLTYTAISEEEMDAVYDDLYRVAQANARTAEARAAVSSAAEFRKVIYYQVPFESCLDLVASRQVLLRRGRAYVPRDRLISIVMGRFRTHLNFCMVRAYKALPAILQDPRFAPRLTNLSKAYVGASFGKAATKSNTVTPKDLDTLAARGSMPLCMSNLHAKLKEAHHLRHGGRMQYGLFLKGVGLSLEDALQFWQAEFTKSMSAEDFIKRYAYNIRHNYGKEGRRKDYSAYNCTRIIMGNPPGAGDHHGCPFRHWEQHHLRGALAKMRISASSMTLIMDSVNNKAYQIACRRMYEATHPGADSNDVGNHPNAYFEASRAFHKDGAGDAAATSEGAASPSAAGAGAGAGAGATSAAFTAPTSAAAPKAAAATPPTAPKAKAPAGSPGTATAGAATATA